MYSNQSNHHLRSRSVANVLLMCIGLSWLVMSCRPSQSLLDADAKAQGWSIEKLDKQPTPSWVISSRSVPGTEMLEYKIEGMVNLSAEAGISFFRQDILDLANGTKVEKDFTTYKLLAKSEEELTTYVIHNEPFPLKDTEMNVRYTFFKDEKGNPAVKWQEGWEDYPIEPSKQYNRVESFRGAWHFSPVSEKMSMAGNSVQFNPGKMPLWLAEPMVFKFLKKGLRELRESASERDASELSANQ